MKTRRSRIVVAVAGFLFALWLVAFVCRGNDKYPPGGYPVLLGFIMGEYRTCSLKGPNANGNSRDVPVLACQFEQWFRDAPILERSVSSGEFPDKWKIDEYGVSASASTLST